LYQNYWLLTRLLPNIQFEMIPVTKPYLPGISKYSDLISFAYGQEWLTNRGKLVLQLEERLMRFLELKSLPLVMNNGTVPLQIAIKLLPAGSSIITTPFSYIATTSSILWEGARPVFADIDEKYLTISPEAIERAINDDTRAILATHVFGNPCDLEKISALAEKYKLLVIYDAAHAFAVKYKGESIFGFGDISTCSFHATKIFHTGEGGAAFINRPELYEAVFQSHNFGHHGPFDYARAGINGKMSELNAAMGHAVLDDFELILSRRKEICNLYDAEIEFGSSLRRFELRQGTEWNYSYYPVIFEYPDNLLEVVKQLNACDIFPRRYFYPSLNTIGLFEKKVSMPVSEYISERILCLPVFHHLAADVQLKIARIINQTV
jgi:dTDP-4-amino-4,6-dideoxygalactose transaminase